jgi:hypothetical protein
MDSLCWVEVEVEVEVNLRPTVSQAVCPGVRRPSGTRDQFFFLLEISYRQLRICYFVAPSLTRGQVGNLLVQLLLGFAIAVTLGSKSRRTHGHILLSYLRLPPTWRVRFPYLYAPGTGWPSYTPGHWIPFLSPHTTRRDYGGGILTHLHTGAHDSLSYINCSYINAGDMAMSKGKRGKYAVKIVIKHAE